MSKVTMFIHEVDKDLVRKLEEVLGEDCDPMEIGREGNMASKSITLHLCDVSINVFSEAYSLTESND